MTLRILVTGGSGFIGTHLIDLFQKNLISCINLDIARPKKTSHEVMWKECNILNEDHLFSIFAEFQPTDVVHLAARATTEGKSLDDFRDNTVGTANVLQAIKATSTVRRVVITSSQHVRKPGSGLPKSDTDYKPHGLYGESKVITEELSRNADLKCIWTIVRPTTVWGAYHPFLPIGLWRLMKKGFYVHPSNDQVIRSYGYVKNVVWQIEQILGAPESIVNRKVYYLGEPCIKQAEWISAFSKALRGADVRKIPTSAIHLLAYVGDSLGIVGLKFPMDSARYFNLTTTNPVPLEPIIQQFGMPPYSLEHGIQETVDWLSNFESV